MVTRIELTDEDIVRESPFSATLFADISYYALRCARAYPRGICWYVDDTPRCIERVIIISAKNKHTCYIKLFGDVNAYTPVNLFETYEDAMEECIDRNGKRTANKLIDCHGVEVQYRKVLHDVSVPVK